jgi:hypothetical protein
LGALIGGFFGAEACLIVAAIGFLAQAAVILLSPVIPGANRANPGMTATAHVFCRDPTHIHRLIRVTHGDTGRDAS